jgi:hypothetical protein
MHLITRLLPKEERTIIALAKIDLEKEKQRTEQTREETKRFGEIREMIESQNITTRRALQVLDASLKAQDSRISDVHSNRSEIIQLKTKLQLYEEQEKEFEQYKKALETVDKDSLARLTSRVRPQIAEVALPLRRSADRMVLSSGARRKVFSNLDRATANDINSRSLDEETSTLEISIKAYDRDTGLGRCDLIRENLSRVPFSVPIDIRTRLRRLVLRAMNEDAVRVQVRLFRDLGKRITSIIIYDISFKE